MGTNRRFRSQRQRILKQLRKFNISPKQIQIAVVERYPHSAGEVAEYLIGTKFDTRKEMALSMAIEITISDILWARAVEMWQINEERLEGTYRAPPHPGIPRRDCAYSDLSRKEFLEIIGPSLRSVFLEGEERDMIFEHEQTERQEGATSTTSAESDFGEEEDDEQENMNENTTRTISDVILEADEFTQIELPVRTVFLVPWLKERSIALASGPRGVGKTMFGIGLAEAIVRGEQFGPWKAGEPVPCLYLDGEMTVQDTQERLRQLNHTSDRKRPLYIYSDAYASHLGMPRAHLVSEEWRTKMKRILLAKGVKVWLVDNLASLTAGIDENSKKDWDPINAWLLELRFAGIATVMLHHTGKGGAQRGTSAREDNVDVSIMLKRPSNYKPLDGARFVVKFEKARVRTRYLPSLADVEFRLTEDEQGRGVWVWKSAKGKTNKVKVLKMRHEGSDYDAITEETGLSKGRISQIKKEAEEKGWLDKKGKLTSEGLRFVYGDEDG